jgi:hypothetical protein
MAYAKSKAPNLKKRRLNRWKFKDLLEEGRREREKNKGKKRKKRTAEELLKEDDIDSEELWELANEVKLLSNHSS